MEGVKLGDLEQSILLGILAHKATAFSLEVRREMERATGKPVSRGAFYTTLERLARKGLVTWEVVQPPNARRQASQRRFTVTDAGIHALRHTRSSLHARWVRLDEALGEPR